MAVFTTNIPRLGLPNIITTVPRSCCTIIQQKYQTMSSNAFVGRICVYRNTHSVPVLMTLPIRAAVNSRRSCMGSSVKLIKYR